MPTWNSEPAEARTVFALYGSTLVPASTTPAAPTASAVRMIVPALPGSRTSAHTTIGARPAAVSSASSTSSRRHTATSPAGVTLSLSEASARSSTTVTGAGPSRSAYVDTAAAVANTSTTRSGTSRAASTAFGPSTRKSRRSERTERRLSFRASLTRVLLLDSGVLAVRGIATASTSGTSGRYRRVDVLGERSLGHLDQRDERGQVVDGQVGQDLAVDLDTREAQALDEAVVGEAVGAGAGVDPLDPQLAELALLLAAGVVAVDQRVGDLLLGLAVEPRALTPVTGGALEDYPALLLGVDRPLDACHVVLLLVEGSDAGAQRPSSFLARGTSALATSVVPDIRRVTL